MPLNFDPRVLSTPSPAINVASTNNATPAVQGSSLTSLLPATAQLAGGIGIEGASGSNIGVHGISESFDAVVGETNSDAHAGVTGRNLTSGANGGVGLYGVGGKYAGKFDGDVQLNGKLNASGNSDGIAIAATGEISIINAALSVLTSPNVQALNIVGDASISGNTTVSGNHTVNGTQTVAVDIVLQGGAGDCAEEFEAEPGAALEPGTVVVFGEKGRLRESHRPYDRKVGGVLSGAGCYRPGLVLDRTNNGSARVPLALIGKVYCKVDAQYHPVEVGNLLTTSPTPGYAMATTDPSKAFGSVFAKALEPLSTGKGLILVLVGLQ